MSKHTQGKWEVSKCTEHTDLHYICSYPNNVVVARTCYAVQSEANAQLISCAPEMLEALKKSKRVIRSLKLSMQAHPDNEPGSEFDDFTQTAERMESEIDEIIKKATL